MANITKLEIETNRLQADIDSLQVELEGMRKTGEQMIEGINALSAMWEGEAKNAFIQQFQSDYEKLTETEEIIGNLIEYFQNAREEYDRCEGDVGAIVNDIRV